ncbi:hypothetical protein RB596_008119 [Gaeumannomyces avenae]
MKAAILLAVATLVLAQDITKYVPTCSFKCLQEAVTSATKCQPLDGKCICDRPNFEAIYNSGNACVLQACGSDTAISMYAAPPTRPPADPPAAQVLPGTYKYCEDVVAGASSVHVATGRPSPRPSDVPKPSDFSILPVTSATLSTTGNSTVTSAGPTTASSTSRGAGTTSAPAGGAAAGGATAGLAAALGGVLVVLL